MDNKRLKVPVQLRVNMWLGLSAYEKKFNSFSEGTFSVFAEMVYQIKLYFYLYSTFIHLVYWYIVTYNLHGKIQLPSQHLKPNTSPFTVLQYENQAHFGSWGTTGLVGRHKFSDVTGKLKLKQEYFIPPRGWEWENDWFIDPEKA